MTKSCVSSLLAGTQLLIEAAADFSCRPGIINILIFFSAKRT